jgi:predicted DNA binding protein
LAFSFLFGGVIFTPVIVEAFKNKDTTNIFTQEQRDALRQAGKEGDSEKIREILEQHKKERRAKNKKGRLTEEQKNTLKEARASGNVERVKELLEEYGVKRGFKKRGHGKEFVKGEMGGHSFRKDLTEEQRESLKQAHESGDCETILQLVKEYEIAGPHSDLTDEQHKELCEAKVSGDAEKIKELLEEYGVKRGFKKRGYGKEFVKGEMGGHSFRKDLTEEQRESLKQAHESGDCETILQLAKEYEIAGPHSDLTDEQHKELCEAKVSGDTEKIKELLEEYGLEGIFPHGKRRSL